MRIGIDQNSEQRVISGARVAFDRRTTAEVDATRDPANRKPRGLRRQTRGFVKPRSTG
ncbi:hypothetical protein CI41S_39790 [Bradyrhizobium ivorense]|nr:hypothetical protein CI41S_39790 [Bradyrhizobium ivorense]